MTDAELQELVDRAVQTLKDAGAREVYLFGSAAKGTMREDSDIDLAVVGLPARVFFKTGGRLMRVVGRPVSLVDLEDDTPFAQLLRRRGDLRRVG